jgi:predicted HAD superfamily Cof-like phosphohydrolase
MKTQYQQVSEFTLLRLNAGKEKTQFVPLPTKPKALTKLEVKKFIGLCSSELVELARTVTSSNAEALEFVKECIGMDPSAHEPEMLDELDVISHQLDAIIDMMIYSFDQCSGKGLPVDKAFEEVHRANMSKTFPDGTFHLTEVAPKIFKVAKPPNFQPPNVRQVIEDALMNGV